MTEDIIEAVITFCADQPWFPIVTAVVALAAGVAAVTPTPKPGSTWAKIYKVLDIIALNIGRAKETGEEKIEG